MREPGHPYYRGRHVTLIGVAVQGYPPRWDSEMAVFYGFLARQDLVVEGRAFQLAFQCDHVGDFSPLPARTSRLRAVPAPRPPLL